MKRRDFLKGTVGAAGALSGLPHGAMKTAHAAETAGKSSSEAGKGRPNILLIMTDQHRYDSLGANGNPHIKTPHLDTLAAQSANFSHVFVQAPVCVPARACYFTGRYAHAHKNRVNYTPIDEDEVLMQARLQDAGYYTALVGKSHLYYSFPFDAGAAARTGFDFVALHDGAGITNRWSDYVDWRNEHDPLHDTCHYRALAQDVPEVAEDLPADANPFRAAIEAQYTDTAWVGLQTREQLKTLAAGSEPFFLFSSYWKPHSPFEVSPPYDALYNDVDIPLPRQTTREDIEQMPLPVQRLILRNDDPPYDLNRERLQWIYRSYYGTVSHIDDEVGKTLETLEDLGIADRTIVVFCSDHGAQLLEHGLLEKNVFYEGSIRVPFMIRYPDHIEPGEYNALVEIIDILPTLFEFLGLDEPYHCHGKSFAPLITGEGGYTPREAVFSENIIPEVIGSRYFFEKDVGVYPVDDPKEATRHPDAKMIRTRRWKYNYYPEGYSELYDLENDPGEYKNLAGNPDYKATEDELKTRILDWLITATETEQIAPRWRM